MADEFQCKKMHCHTHQRTLGYTREYWNCLETVPSSITLCFLFSKNECIHLLVLRLTPYINDMPETATSFEIKLFADDSLIYRTINNQTDSDLLQRDLTILEDWENKYIRVLELAWRRSPFKYYTLLSIL
jgi:hypothetical protein